MANQLPSKPTPPPAKPNLPPPVCVKDYEEIAKQVLEPSIYGYYSSGADGERVLARNEAAYDNLLLRPKVLVDVTKVSTETTLLGQKVSSPIAIAPTAFHGMACDDGERATARAAAASNTLYCLATYSNTSMEDALAAAKTVRNANPLHWFQLYVETDRDSTKHLVQRAEKAGYKALVITVDRPRLGRRLADLRSAFKLPKHLKLGNFTSDNPERSGANAYAGGMVDAGLNWDDIQWFKSITKLPVVIKGIFRYDDAVKAVKAGVDGIVVSNHGGRQLDAVPATLEVLPEVVAAVQGSNVEVYVDGGITRGSDVVKAIALGARAVFLGRPIVYALAYKGEQGVRSLLSMINYEFRLALALTGVTSPQELTQDFVIPAEDLSFSKTLNKYKPNLHGSASTSNASRPRAKI